MCVIACERYYGPPSWDLSVSGVCQTDGSSPLFVASLNGHVEVARALVGAGAAVNQARVRDDCWVAASVRLCASSVVWSAACKCAALRALVCLLGVNGFGD